MIRALITHTSSARIPVRQFMREHEHFNAAFREVTRDKTEIIDRIRKFPKSPEARYISSIVLLEGLGGGLFYLGSSVNPYFVAGGVFPAGAGIAMIAVKVYNKTMDAMDTTYTTVHSAAISKAFESEGKDLHSREQMEAFLKKILYLPPVGSKITLERNSLEPTPLSPTLTADEQIKEIIKLRQEGKLDNAYVQQLTVQGKLPDEFKYAALALIINSTYRNDWTKPFYEMEWAKVAPLIHGGEKATDVNPLWRSIGRTDFLQRVANVHQPKLEYMEQYATPELATQVSSEDLANAVLEQGERKRLILEMNFYQRAAFALHAKKGTLPNAVPPDVARKGMRVWKNFVKDMDNILSYYDASNVTKQRWFTRSPRFRPWGGLKYEFMRHEASYIPIQEALMSLEEVKSKNPSLRQEVNLLMTKTVSSVDNAIGV